MKKNEMILNDQTCSLQSRHRSLSSFAGFVFPKNYLCRTGAKATFLQQLLNSSCKKLKAHFYSREIYLDHSTHCSNGLWSSVERAN